MSTSEYDEYVDFLTAARENNTYKVQKYLNPLTTTRPLLPIQEVAIIFAERKNISMVANLINAVADKPEYEVDWGIVLGNSALKANNRKMVEFLIPHVKDVKKTVALSYAVGMQHEEYLDILLPLYEKGPQNNYILKQALERKNESIAQKIYPLCDVNGDKTLLSVAVKAKSLKWVKELAPLVDAKANYSDAFTCAAFCAPSIEMFKLLAPYSDPNALGGIVLKTLASQKELGDVAVFVAQLPGIQLYGVPDRNGEIEEAKRNAFFLEAVKNDNTKLVDFYLSLSGEEHHQYRYEAFVQSILSKKFHISEAIFNRIDFEVSHNWALKAAASIGNLRWTQKLIPLSNLTEVLQELEQSNNTFAIGFIKQQYQELNRDLMEEIDALIGRVQATDVSVQKLKPRFS